MNTDWNDPMDKTTQREQIRAALNVLAEPGQVVELRAFVPGRRGFTDTHTGYFDDLDAAAAGAEDLDGRGAEAVYVTLNPVEPALLARAHNRTKRAKRGQTTKDEHILGRRWLPVDVDPERPAGISATDEEKQHAFAVARKVRERLAKLGFAEPVRCDSGNGAHLLYRVDLPAKGDTCERLLKALAALHDTAEAKVDTAVHNPARIWKLYGTHARKGDATEDRPHRLAKMLHVPEPVEVTPPETLQAAVQALEADADLCAGAAADGPQRLRGAPLSASADEAEADVREVLSYLPARLDYGPWVHVIAGVLDKMEGDTAAAERLLKERYPEEEKDEYRRKMAAALEHVTFGSVVELARQHGYDPVEAGRRRAAERRGERPTPSATAPRPEAGGDGIASGADLAPALAREANGAEDELHEAGGDGAPADAEDEAAGSAAQEDDGPPSFNPLPPQRTAVPTLHPVALHGIAGEIIRSLRPHTEASDANLLAHLLTFAGCAMGAAPHVAIGTERHPARTFAAIIGVTSLGRKGTGYNATLPFVRHAFPYLSIVKNVQSGQAVVQAVRDGDGGAPEGDELADPGVEDKRLLWHEAEMATIFKSRARQGSTLTEVMRDAWDYGDLANTTKRASLYATKPHVCLAAHTTPEEYRALRTDTEAHNGTLNRVLHFYVYRARRLPLPEPMPDTKFEHLAGKLGKALAEAKARQRVKVSADAVRLYRGELYEALDPTGRGLVAAMTGRGHAQVLRVALIYALLDGAAEVDVPHLHAACAVWQYHVESVQALFTGSTGHRLADRLLNELRAADELKRVDISNLLGRNKSAAEINEALRELHAAGLADYRMEPTGGRPAEVWHAVRSNEGNEGYEGSPDATEKEPSATALPSLLRLFVGVSRDEEAPADEDDLPPLPDEDDLLTGPDGSPF